MSTQHSIRVVDYLRLNVLPEIIEREIESVELQMNTICVSDNKWASVKELVKAIPIGSDAVNVLDESSNGKLLFLLNINSVVCQ